MAIYNSDILIALSAAQDMTGRHATVKSLLAIGAAYHFADMGDDSEAARLVLDTFGAALKESGATKGEVSTKRKNAKIVGGVFQSRFGAELTSDYLNEADFVQACFANAIASGAKSVNRLLDWCVHGDADFTDRKKQAEKVDKDTAREEKANAALASVSDHITNDMFLINPFDTSAPMPKAVQNFEPETVAEPEPIGADDLASGVIDILADVSPEILQALSAAIRQETKRRKDAMAEAEAEAEAA
jgi:hypothetical protein